MGVGDYLSEMFLGNSFKEDGSKKGADELWKIYRQAYNVRPVWDGKKWVIPQGAVQRFQMLLPILQAQISAGRASQGGQQSGGILGGMLGAGTKGILGAIGKKVDGWSGIGETIKNLFSGFGGTDPAAPAWESGGPIAPETPSVAAFGPTDFEGMGNGGFDIGDFGTDKLPEAPINDMTGWSNIPLEDLASNFDFSDLFGATGETWSGMY